VDFELKVGEKLSKDDKIVFSPHHPELDENP
jgi:hypothetical protein